MDQYDEALGTRADWNYRCRWVYVEQARRYSLVRRQAYEGSLSQHGNASSSLGTFAKRLVCLLLLEAVEASEVFSKEIVPDEWL